MVKVEKLAEEPSFGEVSVLDTLNLNGVKVRTYALNKKQAIAVAARLNNAMLMKVIDRLEELENKKAITTPQTYKEALLELIAKEEALERAIATKAEIGSRREATAMNTASQATKKANQLEIELDKSKMYCTIKRMSMLTHGQTYNWRTLKTVSVEMDLPPVDVFDANYETVKAYHKDVWLVAYALEFLT